MQFCATRVAGAMSTAAVGEHAAKSCVQEDQLGLLNRTVVVLERKLREAQGERDRLRAAVAELQPAVAERAALLTQLEGHRAARSTLEAEGERLRELHKATEEALEESLAAKERQRAWLEQWRRDREAAELGGSPAALWPVLQQHAAHPVAAHVSLKVPSAPVCRPCSVSGAAGAAAAAVAGGGGGQ